MREEKIKVLKEMVANGYHCTDTDIQNYSEWFTLEELLRWKDNFFNWKTNN